MIFNYEFSKNWWGFRYLKWVYGVDFAKNGQGFCPIFHLLWITCLLIPLVLIIKIFGSAGSSFMNSLRTYSKRQDIKIRDKFVKKYSTAVLTDEQAWKLVLSRCWRKHKGYLGWERYEEIEHQYYSQNRKINQKEFEKKEYRTTQYKNMKENKWFPYISYFVTGCVGIIFLYLLYQLIGYIPWNTIDWPYIWEVIIGLGIIIGFITIVILFFKYIVGSIINWLDCHECKLCKIGLGKYIITPFKWLGKGCILFGNMIYLTYKRACPLMTIKNEKDN